MDTGIRMSTGSKVLALGAVVLGGVLLFGGKASAAVASTPAPPSACADLEAQFDKMPKTAANLAALVDLANKAKTAGCSDLSTSIQKAIDALGKPVGTLGGGGTILFNPSNVKDKQRLINDAWTLARMGPLDPTAFDITTYHLGSDGSFGSYGDAAKYAATGSAIIDVKTGSVIARSPSAVLTDLQAAAGITADGKYGPESSKAFSWGLSAGSPTSIGVAMLPEKSLEEQWADAALASIGRAQVSDVEGLVALKDTAAALGRPDVAQAAEARIGACCSACGIEEEVPVAVVGYGSGGVFGSGGKFGGKGFGKGK